MFPLILTVLDREYNREYCTTIPTRDCSYKGEHPKLRGHTLRA